nr:hypothetical protein Iba_chr14cCG7900 [Ipomoea batatas]
MPRRRRRLGRLSAAHNSNNNTAGKNYNETMKLRNGKTIERSGSSRIPSERESENDTIISPSRMASNPNPAISHCTAAAQNVGSGVDKCYTTDNAPLPPPPRNKGILIREAAPNANAAHHQSLRIRSSPPTLHNNPSATSITRLGKAPILHSNETRIDDTLKGRAYGSYGNQSSAHRLSPGTNFQPNKPRRNIHIATGVLIHTGSSSHINNTPTGSPSPSMNNRGSELISPTPKFFSFPPPSNPNNLTFHPQLSNPSTLQPPVTSLFGGTAPMPLNPHQQQSQRLMLQLSQLGTTRPPPMTTDANNTTSGGAHMRRAWKPDTEGLLGYHHHLEYLARTFFAQGAENFVAAQNHIHTQIVDWYMFVGNTYTASVQMAFVGKTNPLIDDAVDSTLPTGCFVLPD